MLIIYITVVIRLKFLQQVCNQTNWGDQLGMHAKCDQTTTTMWMYARSFGDVGEQMKVNRKGYPKCGSSVCGDAI